ncbi:hypothetical protein ACIGXM_10220 [Kitasatospora sp. NPDC052896]|uniref:hypothetical protein n=1 Tax=Kitasatospora sp. NPDC052896 TaxID=3364061 RepID=UPI0037C989B4
MSIAEPLTEALRRRNEVQERHRLQLAALDAYSQALERTAQAQANLSRTVAGAVEAFGGLDITANLLDLTIKEVRTHVAAHEAASQEAAPAADAAPVPAARPAGNDKSDTSDSPDTSDAPEAPGKSDG